MQTSDGIKAHLHHGSHELAQVQQLVATIQHLVATASDHIKTTYDEIQVCSDRADLIDPAISALTHQIHALTEEMDRVYSLRNDEIDLYLRQENNNLKKEIAALQQALTCEREEHQARLAASVKSNEELVQRNGSLERFCQMLKSKLNEMKEMYESAIIDVAELKATNKTLQNTPGKYYRGRKPSLDSTDQLQLSMSLPTRPLQIFWAVPQLDRSRLAGQWLRQTVD